MSTGLRKWLPMVLCSAPGLVVAGAALVGIAIWGTAFVSSPLGLGLITLAVLACPLNMVLTMIINRRQAASGASSTVTSCCMPGQNMESTPTDSPADRLATLRDRRVALERELAELQRS
jgi:ABC-type transport system involved in multi-copper enzyme maturation permease subunit